MQEKNRSRCIVLGQYMVQYQCTVRQAANAMGVPKSTVHQSVTEYLKRWDEDLYASVRAILDKNKAERHIRGGMATKKKFAEMRKAKENKQ